MKESRYIEIKGKRFKTADVIALATIFKEEAELSKKADHHYSLSFKLSCRDGISYESENIEVFTEDASVGVRPPVALEMEFHDYKLSRSLSLTAVQGGSYRDRLFISGEESKWVHSVFIRAKERIDALETTDNWFTEHDGLTALIGMLGLGSLMGLILFLVVMGLLRLLFPAWRPDPAILKSLKENVMIRFIETQPFTLIYNCFWRFAMGGVPWFYFQRWFYEAFPSIELAFGPEHLRIEVQRRKRLWIFLTVVGAPLILSFVYDFVKPLVIG